MDIINRETAITLDERLPGGKYWVDMANALDRLYRNEDFKRVILEGYFKDKAIRGVSLLANDQTKRIGARPDVMEGLIAVSALEDHFKAIRLLGEEHEDEDENELTGQGE